MSACLYFAAMSSWDGNKFECTSYLKEAVIPYSSQLLPFKNMGSPKFRVSLFTIAKT